MGGGQSIKLDHRSKVAGLPELAVSMPWTRWDGGGGGGEREKVSGRLSAPEVE